MTEKRWRELMGAPGNSWRDLKKNEIALGWHFCYDYDGLLINPTMGEWHTCNCYWPSIRLSFEQKCVAAGFKLAPTEDFKNISGNENIYF